MKNKLLFFCFLSLISLGVKAQISTIPSNWTVPYLTTQASSMGSVNGAGFTFVDINGDGYPDLIDAQDNNSSTGSIWENGAQRYWKVYLNNGTAINTVPQTWNVPYLTTQASSMGSVSGAGYSFVDINGDGYPDLIDAQDNTSSTGSVWENGAQRYWKVYLNNGTAINTVPQTWNVPYLTTQASAMGSVSGAGYSFVDINGDGYPDLIDAQDNTSSTGSVWENGAQRYWKVYLNNGTAINTVPQTWNVPYLTTQASSMGSVNGGGYSFVDVNGDGYPDLVDAQDNTSSTGSVWENGAQRYWKVYLNNGSAINTVPVNWTVPYVTTQASAMGSVSGAGYSFVDINGDSKPDIVDARDNTSSTGSVWENGAQRYWKVYLNKGTAINTIPETWNVPYVTTQASAMGSLSGAGYSFVDINGDAKPDLIDAQDNTSSNGSVWTEAATRYWKVYLNEFVTIDTSTSILNLNEQVDFLVYPNPAKNQLKVDFETPLSNALVTVFDITGLVVYKEHTATTSSLNLDVSNYTSGVYFIGIKTEEAFSTVKFIKK